MGRKIVLVLAVIFVMMVSLNLALAEDEKSLSDQELEQEQKYDKLYDKGRFDAADTDKDGILSKAEIEQARIDFGYYLNEKKFKHADTNNDGAISKDEAKAERRWIKSVGKSPKDPRVEELKDKKVKRQSEKLKGKVVPKKFGTVEEGK